MIQANELRIGNWVMALGIYKDSFERAGNVKVDAELIKLCDENKIGLLSISLTPEILERCGFEKDENIQQDFSYILQLKARLIIAYYTGDANCLSIWQDGYLIDLASGVCKHLHQLQNLYFALTGEELEINL